MNGNRYYDLNGTASFTKNGVTSSGIAAWKTTSGQEASSSEGNPQLRNGLIEVGLSDVRQMTTVTNYWPATGSPLLGAGLDIQTLYNISPGGYDAGSNQLNRPYNTGAYNADGTAADPLVSSN
jgi:hypothetical protein